MEVDNSNVYVLNSDNENETSSTDKPILDLFNRLIHGENKQNTVLTNAQIVEIMQKEFDIDIKTLHTLEEEIYLTIMKKFLKDWPEWDEFDKNVNNLNNKPQSEKNIVFDENYTSLKSYLKTALDIAMPLAKKTVQTLAKEVSNTTSPESDVVLEIEATRDQLNHLIYRHPNADLSNTIFNITRVNPSKIIGFTPSLQSILNWWGVNIYIYPEDANYCIYRRYSKHEFHHMLVNKKLLVQPTPLKVLDQQLKIKGNIKAQKLNTSHVIDALKHLCELYSYLKNMDELFDFIQKDMSLLPPYVAPASCYRRYTNKYPYVRYLYDEVQNVTTEDYEKYDIQLQETISPVYELYLGTIDQITKRKKHGDDFIVAQPVVVECSICGVMFKTRDLIAELKTHFGIYHQHEVDFKCTNCGTEFAIEALSQNWWCHKC